jgi:hypothetical protein
MNYMTKVHNSPSANEPVCRKIEPSSSYHITPASLCEVCTWMVQKFPECLVLKQCNIESVQQRCFSTYHPQSLRLRACTATCVANTTEQIIFLDTLWHTNVRSCQFCVPFVLPLTTMKRCDKWSTPTISIELQPICDSQEPLHIRSALTSFVQVKYCTRWTMPDTKL